MNYLFFDLTNNTLRTNSASSFDEVQSFAEELDSYTDFDTKFGEINSLEDVLDCLEASNYALLEITDEQIEFFEQIAFRYDDHNNRLSARGTDLFFTESQVVRPLN